MKRQFNCENLLLLFSIILGLPSNSATSLSMSYCFSSAEVFIPPQNAVVWFCEFLLASFIRCNQCNPISWWQSLSNGPEILLSTIYLTKTIIQDL